jgi:hypothetical protein
MSDESKISMCQHCGFPREASQTVYRLLESRPSYHQEETRIDMTKGIDIQILRCSNPKCEFIELKAPKRWPERVPRQS